MIWNILFSIEEVHQVDIIGDMDVRRTGGDMIFKIKK